MKNISPGYYRSIITVLLLIVFISIYSFVRQNISFNESARMIDKYYNDATEAYEQGNYDRSKAQISNVIASMKVIEYEMDSLSHLQIDHSIGELELLQKTMNKDIIWDDVVSIIFSRSLNSLTFGEIKLAQKEFSENNIEKGISFLNSAKAHLLTSLVYLRPTKQSPNQAMIGQISTLLNSIEHSESYSEKLQLLSKDSRKLLIAVN